MKCYFLKILLKRVNHFLKVQFLVCSAPAGSAPAVLDHVTRGQTDRGYKKPEPEPDISTLLFVSFNRNRIFQIAIRLGIKRIRIIRYSYPFQKKPELNIQPDNSFKTDIT